MTLSEYLTAYTTRRAACRAARTIEAELRYIRLYIARVSGDIALSALNTEHIQAILTPITDAGHTRTAEAVYVYLQSAAKKCAPLKDALACVARPVHMQKSIDYWSQAEASRFLRFASPQWRLCWLLMLCCGLRRGEAAGLRWCDVDTKHMMLNIRNQRIALKGRVIDSPPKRHKQRHIPISDQLADALSAALFFHDAAAAIGGAACEYVVSIDGKNPIHPTSINHALYRDISVAGVPRISAHGLRHTFASLCVEQNAGIRIIQDVLGHANVTTTAKTYAHVTDNPRRDMLTTVSKSIIL